MSYDYILDKIRDAQVTQQPFEHLEINDLFTVGDFAAITQSRDVLIEPSANDTKLFENLFDNGYRIIGFPGCIQDHRKYIDWHQSKNSTHQINTSCEGFGIVVRLAKAQSPCMA